jgi:hypothetical protein
LVPSINTCNPSYSGGRCQEDHGSKPARANNSQDPISKNPSHAKKRAGGVVDSEGPEFKPQYCKKKKKVVNLDPYLQARVCGKVGDALPGIGAVGGFGGTQHITFWPLEPPPGERGDG